MSLDIVGDTFLRMEQIVLQPTAIGYDVAKAERMAEYMLKGIQYDAIEVQRIPFTNTFQVMDGRHRFEAAIINACKFILAKSFVGVRPAQAGTLTRQQDTPAQVLRETGI
jgi:hypothetical protein